MLRLETDAGAASSCPSSKRGSCIASQGSRTSACTRIHRRALWYEQISARHGACDWPGDSARYAGSSRLAPGLNQFHVDARSTSSPTFCTCPSPSHQTISPLTMSNPALEPPAGVTRPIVFFDIMIGDTPAGRIKMGTSAGARLASRTHHFPLEPLRLRPRVRDDFCLGSC